MAALDNLAYLGPNNLSNAPLSMNFKNNLESVKIGLENSALNNVVPEAAPITQGPGSNALSYLIENWQLAILAAVGILILLTK